MVNGIGGNIYNMEQILKETYSHEMFKKFNKNQG